MLAGCSTITEGSSQTLTFSSDPDGAECKLMRNGVQIGKLVTPGAIRVEKTKHDIEVTCAKDGYQSELVNLKSDAAAMTFGNLILGGGIGWAIDSATGSDNKYTEVTHVLLKKKS
ncbi:hypothetical protein [Ferrovibrio sp.]|uniref:hypothetical protein n=1 Tax=Ferrovibrio sp. TaxID=1917215 RepID=UPI0035195301